MNYATRIIVAVIGVVLAIGGMSHGVFEVLQGNTPTNGLIIQAIGPARRMWHYGFEEAFTLIPNFLVTGILIIFVSLAIIVGSVGFVYTKHGDNVLGLLFMLLFLVGGGIAAQVIFAPLVWATAVQINGPLTHWRKKMPKNVQCVLAKLRPLQTLSAQQNAPLKAVSRRRPTTGVESRVRLVDGVQDSTVGLAARAAGVETISERRIR